MSYAKFLAITRGWVLAAVEEAAPFETFRTFWRRLDGNSDRQLVIVHHQGHPYESYIVSP